ncbi:hypothetical protein Gogos_020504, partial [Gossypium gossypioides]|nr:hypothetical protein [Gossypium gossypioides]
VTCNPTLNGDKPFINVNGIDLEVLGKAIFSNAILISCPVTYSTNCDRINKPSVRVNLSGTPFFFSSDMNYFGSVGCGNWATILRSEADSLGGCSQPRCDDGASESGCFTEITANLTSYTVKMRAMYPDSKRCASAFIFSKYSFRDAYPFPSGINNGTTHVPAVLNWNSSYCGEGDAILINNPVTYINCSKASVSVNLSGTPFFFSSDMNYFGSVGFGNLATILSNEGDSLGGCIQLRSDDAMYPDSERCASAFILSVYSFSTAYSLSTGINIGTTHVPAVLSWKSTDCGGGGCYRPGLGPINFNPYKVEQCGNVTFHYPFSMEDHDDSNEWFKVICTETANGEKVPFLDISATKLQILDFNFLAGTLTVNHSITYSNCRENHHNGMSLNLTGTRFYYSDPENNFWSSGCGNLVTIFGNETKNLISGFLQPSCRINNKTSSIVGCPLVIPKGLSSFFANMSNMDDSSDYRRKRSCGFVSLISYGYDFHDDFDISNRTHVPMQLQWSTQIFGKCHLLDSSNISCTFDGDYCWSRLSSIHLCACFRDTSDISYLRSCKGMS